MNARTCRAFSNHGSLLRRVLPTVRYLSANTAVSYTVPPPPNNGAPSSPSLSHHIISSISGDSMPNHSNSIEPPVQSPPGRFDWRQRASSRRPPKQPEVNADGKRVYIKRIAAPSVDLQPGEAYYDEVQSYIAKFMPLLEAEEAEEEAVFKQRLAAWSLQRLKKQGYCLTGLSAFWQEEKHYGLPVANFSLGPGVALPTNHRFDKGTQILVSRLDPLKEEHVKGSVLTCSDTSMQVTFDKNWDIEGEQWRVDLGTSNIAYTRMRDAMRALNADPTENDSAEDDSSVVIHKGTLLRDVLLRSFSPDSVFDVPTLPSWGHEGAFAQDQRIQSWVKRHARPSPLHIQGDPDLKGMNTAQIRAIAAMLGERVSLVQGPPGTGKTKTIVEAVRLLKGHFEVPHPLVVCTYTNVAVDHLVEGLAAAGLKPLRFGSVQRVPTALLPHTLDHQYTNHRLQPDLHKAMQDADLVEKSVMEYARSAKDLEGDKRMYAIKKRQALLHTMAMKERRLLALKKKAYSIRMTMLRDILAQADVICTTCVSAASTTFDAVDFPVVFLDEASMSTEPASLIPLMKGSRHVALIGDHKQLPPVITSREAQTAGLGLSLFERLIHEGAVPSVMLDTQYRMHPSLARFPSGEFYDDLLQDGVLDMQGAVPAHLSPPTSKLLVPADATGNVRPSVVFLDHMGNESISDRSRVNWNEAHIACSVIEDLLLRNEDLTGADIGVIAPYAAQVSLLKRLMGRDSGYAERFQITLGHQRAAQIPLIEVGTVDAFEGREKAVVIFSTVRNNPRGQLGFVADARRLNVGLTRAKRGLFIIGRLDTLRSASLGRRESEEVAGEGWALTGGTRDGVEAWRRYAEFLSRQGAVVRLSGDALAQVLYGNLPHDFKTSYLRQSRGA